jgi:hypothetical protein
MAEAAESEFARLRAARPYSYPRIWLAKEPVTRNPWISDTF